MMVLLLMFFALSVSFDSLCVTAPSTAVMMLALGFCFVVVVTELLLASLRIRMPSLFKTPFYSMLGLSFFYPLLIPLRAEYFPEFDTRWLLLMFPLLCSVAILSLIPAIRRGSNYVSLNGTPWTWPMFPFAAFVLLIVGLCGRTILLSIAFDPSPGTESVFGLYFLAPILLASLVVLLEIGIAERKEDVWILAIVSIPFTVLLAFDWSSTSHITFADEVTSIIAAPSWLMLIAVISVYAFAAQRQVEGAVQFLFLSLLAAMFISPRNGIAMSPSAISVWPCVVIALLGLGSAEKFRSTICWAVAACWMVLPVTKAGSWAGSYAGISGLGIPIGLQWILLAALVIGFVFKDRLALQLRIVAAFGIPVFAVGCLIASGFLDLPIAVVLGYAGVLCLLACGIFVAFGDKLYLCASVLVFGVGLVVAMSLLPFEVSGTSRNLVWFSAAGLACFGAGVFVSCLKAGLAGTFRKSYNRLIVDVQYPFVMLEQPPLESD